MTGVRRRTRLRTAWLLLLAMAATLVSQGQARALSLLELNFWVPAYRFDGAVPVCEDTWALDKISSRFQQKEAIYWGSPLQIVRVDHIRETAFRPWGPHHIPRRYCEARVLTNDGKKRTMRYWIGEDTGIIGATWGVEFCVVGLDRNWAYAPRCRMAGP